MSWLDYYRLLERYQGNIGLAKKRELEWARRNNQENPAFALLRAKERYEQDHSEPVTIHGYCADPNCEICR